jgi:hypothetical protein
MSNGFSGSQSDGESVNAAEERVVARSGNRYMMLLMDLDSGNSLAWRCETNGPVECQGEICWDWRQEFAAKVHPLVALRCE